MTVLLTRKAVLQTAMETTYNVAASVGNSDGQLVSNPAFTVQPNVLERTFVHADLSPQPILIGRKLAKMTFETELRGNGRQQSGMIADAPILVRMFRACGYALSGNAASAVLGPYASGIQLLPVTWASSAMSATNTDAVQYVLTVDTPGVSGTAKITITSDTVGEASASAAVTSGTPITLGTLGATVTPTWTGSLAVGMKWVVWLMPSGLALMPVSDSFESITLVMHKDGVKHVMAGSFGTFEITASAGAYATVKWTFTGTYAQPVDDANPTPVFETELPSQVQLARLNMNLFHAIVEKFTFNQMNDIQIRPDVSSSDGYIGTRIVSRKPEGGINPEADNVANNDFWGQMASSMQMPFEMRCGTAIGNTVWFFAPNCQYSGLTYADRNGILVYDAGLRFGRSLGNDESVLLLHVTRTGPGEIPALPVASTCTNDQGHGGSSARRFASCRHRHREPDPLEEPDQAL